MRYSDTGGGLYIADIIYCECAIYAIMFCLMWVGGAACMMCCYTDDDYDSCEQHIHVPNHNSTYNRIYGSLTSGVAAKRVRYAL